MSQNIPYFKSKFVTILNKLFLSNLENYKLIKENSQKIKSKIFDIFATQEFLYAYKRLAVEVAYSCYGNPLNTCLQLTPTPRVFFPGSHGTSVHCDYWYGHGETAFTIWVPILNCLPGSTFYSDHFNEIGYDHKSDSFKIEDLTFLKEKLSKPEFYILPPNDSCYVFNSSTLHGSTLNTKSLTRLSFDFRISKLKDKSSNKDLNNYFFYNQESKNYEKPSHLFFGKSVLKYICGGKGKSTFAQNILMEASAKKYGFLITDQEAEIERFGSPILDSLLNNGLKLSNDYAGLIIPSVTILNQNSLELLKKTNIKVWSAMEDVFLN